MVLDLASKDFKDEIDNFSSLNLNPLNMQHVNITSPSLAVIPRIDFLVSWNPIPGITANDLIEFSLFDITTNSIAHRTRAC